MQEVFPKRLREVREKRQLTQADLAKKARLQPTAISHFERGIRTPSYNNFRRLTDALNVSADYLMGRSELESMVGPHADKLFRGMEKLSEENLAAMEMMKEALLKKKGKNE
jgi:transcriptional regulator with XRE-family HTH domain